MPRPEKTQKCAVCNHILNYTDVFENGVLQGGNWTHGQTWLDDHPATPVDVDAGGFGPTIMCDFCSAVDNEVAWIETSPFQTYLSPEQMHDDDGKWSICQGCVDVWDKDDHKPLLDRVINLHIDRGGLTPAKAPEVRAKVLEPVYKMIAKHFIAIHYVGKEGDGTSIQQDG